MKPKAPEGWEEVFHGACVEANLVQAVLEANGLKPVIRELGSQGVWSGSVFEDCRVYVPVGELDAARDILESESEPGA